MAPTERSPRPDPAVESGQVENPVEVRDEADTPSEGSVPEGNPPDDEPSEEGVSGIAPEGGSSAPYGVRGMASPRRSPPAFAPGVRPRRSPPAFAPGFAPDEAAKGKGGKGRKGEAAFVGEAGEVEFRVENGILNLVGVSAGDGWSYQLGKQDFDEVKVFFLGDDSRWEFEA